VKFFLNVEDNIKVNT